MSKGVPLVLPPQLNLGPRFAATAPRPGKLLCESLRQPTAGTVCDMDTPKRGQEAVLTDRLSGVELRKRGLQQIS